MGRELLEILVQNCGLPEDYARNRLYFLIEESGKSPDDVTLEDIRQVLSSLLQEIILDN